MSAIVLRFCYNYICSEVLGLYFLFLDDNATLHRTNATEELLKSEDIQLVNLLERSPDLYLIEHLWELLMRYLAERDQTPVPILGKKTMNQIIKLKLFSKCKRRLNLIFCEIHLKLMSFIAFSIEYE